MIKNFLIKATVGYKWANTVLKIGEAYLTHARDHGPENDS
jgi:hypothetical protein